MKSLQHMSLITHFHFCKQSDARLDLVQPNFFQKKKQFGVWC